MDSLSGTPSHPDDNSLIGCTGHDSTADWSQPAPISLTACAHFAAHLGAFFYRTSFIMTTMYRTVRQYHSDSIGPGN